MIKYPHVPLMNHSDVRTDDLALALSSRASFLVGTPTPPSVGGNNNNHHHRRRRRRHHHNHNHQLRRVKSTVYLTGKPSDKTKKRMIDLLAPSKGDVVVATTAGSTLGLNSRASSYRSDLGAMEDGGGGSVLSQANIEDYRGVLKEDDHGGNDEDEQGSGRTDHVTDDDVDGSSVLGDSVWGGASSMRGGGSLLGAADSAFGAPSVVRGWPATERGLLSRGEGVAWRGSARCASKGRTCAGSDLRVSVFEERRRLGGVSTCPCKPL